jgi:hypothetical protein
MIRGYEPKAEGTEVDGLTPGLRANGLRKAHAKISWPLVEGFCRLKSLGKYFVSTHQIRYVLTMLYCLGVECGEIELG